MFQPTRRAAANLLLVVLFMFTMSKLSSFPPVNLHIGHSASPFDMNNDFFSPSMELLFFLELIVQEFSARRSWDHVMILIMIKSFTLFSNSDMTIFI